MGRDTRHLSAADKRQLGRDILRVPNETLLDVGRELLHIDMTDMARRIVVPTLVIDGSDARMVPASASKELSRVIPGANWRVIRNAGHNVAIEKPASSWMPCSVSEGEPTNREQGTDRAQ